MLFRSRSMACALLNIPCKIFMGAIDIERQLLNVKRMKLLGAEVVSCDSGTKTLKDAVDSALRYYIEKSRVLLSAWFSCKAAPLP